MPYPCFWTESTQEVELGLRRYRFTEGDGVGAHFHNAERIIDRVPARYAPVDELRHHDKADCYLASIDVEEFRDHPWWPVQCACGVFFTDDDEWQVTQEVIYRAIDGRGEWRQRNLPVGALFDACWAPAEWRNPDDGMAVTVVLPPAVPDGADTRGHQWNVDGPSSKKVPDPTPEDPEHTKTILVPHAWTRTGDPKAIPPTVAVTPSIDTGEYHSYLSLGPGGSELGDG